MKAIAGLAKLQVAAGQLEQAKALLATAPAPAPGKEPDPAIAAVLAALNLAEQASAVGELAPLQQAVAANPDDHKSRFDLAVALSAKGDRRGPPTNCSKSSSATASGMTKPHGNNCCSSSRPGA